VANLARRKKGTGGHLLRFTEGTLSGGGEGGKRKGHDPYCLRGKEEEKCKGTAPLLRKPEKVASHLTLGEGEERKKKE